MAPEIEILDIVRCTTDDKGYAKIKITDDYNYVQVVEGIVNEDGSVEDGKLLASLDKWSYTAGRYTREFEYRPDLVDGENNLALIVYDDAGDRSVIKFVIKKG